MQDVLWLAAAWLGVSALVFLARLWPLRKKSSFGIDLWTWLLYRDEIKNKFPPRDGESETVLIRDGFDAPPLFAFILAILPKEKNEFSVRFINPIIDSLHALLIMVVTYLFSGSIAAASLAGVLIVFTPLALVDSWTLTARPFSSLLYSLLVVSLLFAVHAPLLYVASALIFSFILLGHKMTTQVAFFTLIVASIVFMNLVYILVIIAGTAAALLLSRGFYWKILRGHLTILNFWANSKKTLRSWPSNYWAWFAYGVAKITLNPWVFFAMAFYALLPAERWTPEISILFVFFASSLALFVLTAFKQLSFLGENHRYAYYPLVSIFVPTAILVSEKAGALENSVVPEVLFLCTIVFCLVESFFVWRILSKSEGIEPTRELRECVAYLKNRKEKRLWSLSDAALMIARYSGKRVLVSRSIAATLKKYSFFVIPPNEKNFPGLVKKIVKEFRVQLIVTHSNKKKLAEVLVRRKLARKLFDNGVYCIYKIY